MKTTSLLALAACGGIIAAPIAIQFGRGDTNAPRVTMPPPSRLDSPERSEMPGKTNGHPALQSTPTTVLDAKTMTWVDWSKDTNAVMALPYVQQALKQVWSEGSQFGIAAAIQNKTLVQMENAQELQKAAMFLRFGNQKGAR